MPRIDGQTEAEQELSACESALYSALDNDEVANSSALLVQRYFASRSAWSQWLDVAAHCSARFDEGVIRSAQAASRAVTLGSHLGIDSDTWDDLVEELVLSSEEESANLTELVDLSAAALAEDRVGFALEVLAARGADNATLSLSDWHKTIAELLASAAEEDTRQKVYDVEELLTHPNTTTDAANGLRASTVAIIEMDCTRSLIAAANTGGTASSDDNDSTDTADEIAAMRAYAALAVEHAYRAIQLGYPAIDEALLVTTSDTSNDDDETDTN